MWPFNTGDCLIEVTTKAGLTIVIISVVLYRLLQYYMYCLYLLIVIDYHILPSVIAFIIIIKSFQA